MSQKDFDAKIQEILAMPDSATVTPNLPVAVAIQEAEDLLQWAYADKEVLEKAGLNWNLVTDLPARAGACRHAQSMWMKDYQTQQDAEAEWKKKSPDAFNLRDELVHDFFHAFYNHSDLTRRVQAIAEGGGNADMLQDLSDLAVLGSANLPLLKVVGLEESKLEQARQVAEELSDVLAKANGQRYGSDTNKRIRDKAFSFLKQAVDEIRRHGQYLFWRDENRKKGYVSKYLKSINRTKPSDKGNKVN